MKVPNTAEILWITRAQCGDREALESLLRDVQPVLQRYVRRLASAELADDIVQETLIAIARKLRWLSEPRLFRAWAFRIASRQAFRHLRRERRWAGSDEVPLDSLPSAEPPPEIYLRAVLESDLLAPASRAVLTLHFHEGLTLPEVAAILEIPLGTAKSRLAYGLTVLRRHFGVKKESSHG